MGVRDSSLKDPDGAGSLSWHVMQAWVVGSLQ